MFNVCQCVYVFIYLPDMKGVTFFLLTIQGKGQNKKNYTTNETMILLSSVLKAENKKV